VGAFASPIAKLADLCQTEGMNQANGAKVAAELAKTFAVHDDEVAIFQLEKGQLKFVYPTRLSNVGMIPLNHSSSVASRTANTKRPEIVNNFAQTRHASVFEAVPLESKTRTQKPEPGGSLIQKMMSVPVMTVAGVVGVIQVSRKGATPQAAGPDFQPADLQKLVMAAGALAKCFK
jgi:hypothetical protein